MSETVSELLRAGEIIREINLLFSNPANGRPGSRQRNLILIRKWRNADCFPLQPAARPPGLTAWTLAM